MGLKITRSSDELHPEGWFLFRVVSMEESKGKFGTQIKWGMESRERREDGEKFTLAYYTGTVLSTHPECKLSRLLEKMEIDDEEFEEDTDCALNCEFAGKVEHSDDGRHFNIVNVDTLERLKRRAAKAKDATEGRKKAKNADPFEEE